MANLDLSRYGITDVKEIVYNPSYELLFKDETNPALLWFEKGNVTELGAVNVMTGEFTGRSPKDKFIIKDETTRDTIWWTSDQAKNDNKPTLLRFGESLKSLLSNNYLVKNGMW